MTDQKPAPREFWIIKWSVGFECRTQEPKDALDFIPVIEKSALLEAQDEMDSVKAENNKLREALDKFHIHGTDGCTGQNGQCEGRVTIFSRGNLCLSCQQARAALGEEKE